MANFYREPDRRQRFLLPVDMADWVHDVRGAGDQG